MADENDSGEIPTEVDTPENVDVTVYEAKIAELTEKLTASEVTIGGLTGELNAAKAANYDLLKSLPAEDTSAGDTEIDVNDVEADVDIDDLFEKKD